MNPEVDRTRRVGELLHRELAALLVSDIDDPRLSRVSIIDVEVTRDLKLATVFVTKIEEDTEHRELMVALRRASGYLRHLLSQRLSLRVTPELRFRYDASVERGIALSSLIDEAMSSTPESQ